MLEVSRIEEAIRQEGGVSRRLFLAYAASLSALPAWASRSRAATAPASFSSNPFTLGVASGDPSPTGMVLWTRLAPRPLEPGGGLGPEPIETTWEVAEDERMQRVVQRGTATAPAQLAHSVHVEVDGLRPDRWFWYRFRAGDAESVVGRTRTMPRRADMPQELRFAFASCQHYETGLYTAYDHMVRDELDLVFHLGDYIYEREGLEGRLRKHIGEEIVTLDDYRVRHAQYRSDPLLQAAHAHCPWMLTWDDHEFDNNYSNDVTEAPHVPAAYFMLRRANAYQAYYEMMPLRARSIPRGPDMQLYRGLSFGRLAKFLVLDTRQYRTDQPNGDGRRALNAAAMAPQNTMLGAKQLDWVQRSLGDSNARWNVLAQQVMMAMVDQAPGNRRRYSMDQWPGYAHERMELARFIDEHKVANPVVLTGDIHSHWVNNLRVDDRRAEARVVATEFVGTSISSGVAAEKQRDFDTLAKENACVQFYNEDRGYVRCRVTPDQWQSDFRVVKDVSTPGQPAATEATFVVSAGLPGAERA